MMAEIIDWLRDLHEKGVTLWEDNGVLRYAAPPNVLTNEDLTKIATHEGSILDFYGGSSSGDAVPLAPRLPCEPPTVTFQQQWYAAYLERMRIRHVFIGCATEWVGPLDLEALRLSIENVIQRHEALRTHISLRGGSITQRIAPSSSVCGYSLEVVTLDGQPQEAEARARRLGRDFISDPPDWATAPAFHARLLKLSHASHILLVTVDHWVADGWSIGIVNRDILLSYIALTKGSPTARPAKPPMQYSDYAAWQRRTAASWETRHGAYWRDQLTGAQRIRWPIDNASTDAPSFRYATANVQIEPTLTHELRAFAQRRGTTVPRAC